MHQNPRSKLIEGDTIPTTKQGDVIEGSQVFTVAVSRGWWWQRVVTLVGGFDLQRFLKIIFVYLDRVVRV